MNERVRRPRARQYPSDGGFDLTSLEHVLRGAEAASYCTYLERVDAGTHISLFLWRVPGDAQGAWERRRDLRALELRYLPVEWADAFIAAWSERTPGAQVKSKTFKRPPKGLDWNVGGQAGA